MFTETTNELPVVVHAGRRYRMDNQLQHLRDVHNPGNVITFGVLTIGEVTNIQQQLAGKVKMNLN